MIEHLRALPAAICVAGLALLTMPATAQRIKNVPQAFALVQAPEAAVEVCLSVSVQTAIDCARKRCSRKAGQGACFAVTACEPVGWAGMMGVQLSEVHFTSAVCGAPSREALFASLKAFCDGQAGVKRCVVSHLWSPDGKQHADETSWTPSEPKAGATKPGSIESGAVKK